MNKNFFIGRLKAKLIWALLLSLALAAGLFLLLQTASEGLLENYLIKTSFIKNQQSDALSAFQDFVAENRIATTDHEKMAAWVRNEKYVNVYLFKDNLLLFATDGYKAATQSREYLFNATINDQLIYNLEFSDTNARVYMEFFFEYKYYYIVTILNVAVSVLAFIVLILIFINQKTSYISRLEQEIKILEGGNLDYPISIRGNDELSSLAASINEMRRSFIERLNSENNAKVANRELVTAMSHDLRTPLTALLGYLDIIKYEKYKTREDLIKYIHNSRDKAYQIKQLSDKLFEYFTVFKTDEDDLELDAFNGNELIDQLIDEQLLILQNNRFQFHLDTFEQPFTIHVHLVSIRRVFDNIFSNIIKYGNKSIPVNIRSDISERLLSLTIENHINTDIKKEIGTGIGIKTCARIIEKHHGHFSISRTKEVFTVHISFTIQERLN